MKKFIILALALSALSGCSLSQEKPMSAYELRKINMKSCIVGFLNMDLKSQESLELCSTIDSLPRGR